MIFLPNEEVCFYLCGYSTAVGCTLFCEPNPKLGPLLLQMYDQVAWNVIERFMFEHNKNFAVFDDWDVKVLSDYVWIGSSWNFIMSPIIHLFFFY